MNQVPYSNPNKERLDELNKQVKKINVEVTYLRNQNSQLQAPQRSMHFDHNKENREPQQGKKIDRGQHFDRGQNFERGQSFGKKFDRGEQGGQGFDKRQPPRKNRT